MKLTERERKLVTLTSRRSQNLAAWVYTAVYHAPGGSRYRKDRAISELELGYSRVDLVPRTLDAIITTVILHVRRRRFTFAANRSRRTHERHH